METGEGIALDCKDNAELDPNMFNKNKDGIKKYAKNKVDESLQV